MADVLMAGQFNVFIFCVLYILDIEAVRRDKREETTSALMPAILTL